MANRTDNDKQRGNKKLKTEEGQRTQWPTEQTTINKEVKRS